MQPGSRAFLRHGPAKAAAIFVGTAEPAPFLQSIENARATDLRRICGGFAAGFPVAFPVPAGRNCSVETARTMRKSRQRSRPPAAMPADMPADIPADRRRASGRPGGAPVKEHSNGPDTRIPGYGDAPGAASEAQAGRSGIRFSGMRFIERSSENASKKRRQKRRSSLPFRRTSGLTAPTGHPKAETAPETWVAQRRRPRVSLECTQRQDRPKYRPGQQFRNRNIRIDKKCYMFHPAGFSRTCKPAGPNLQTCGAANSPDDAAVSKPPRCLRLSTSLRRSVRRPACRS